MNFDMNCTILSKTFKFFTQNLLSKKSTNFDVSFTIQLNKTSNFLFVIINLRRNSEFVCDYEEDDDDEENRTHDDGGQGQPLRQVEVGLVQVSAVAGVEADLGVEDEVELGEFEGQFVDHFVVFSAGEQLCRHLINEEEKVIMTIPI